jgi:tRNA G18 (ribose-2'-O)-methylase SpoU
MKLNAKELRDVDEKEVADKLKSIKRRPIYFILENIYDTYNIGGLFRLADALAIEKMYICGESEIPPNSKIKKASIGTYKVVNWEYKKTSKEAIDDLKSKFQNPKSKQIPNSNFQFPNQSPVTNNHSPISIIAVEQHKNSIPYQKADYSMPVALIFGNESYGVNEETLKLCDQIVEIPMFGVNKSLNVIVSAAIISYWVINPF